MFYFFHCYFVFYLIPVFLRLNSNFICYRHASIHPSFHIGLHLYYSWRSCETAKRVEIYFFLPAVGSNFYWILQSLGTFLVDPYIFHGPPADPLALAPKSSADPRGVRGPQVENRCSKSHTNRYQSCIQIQTNNWYEKFLISQ